MPEGPSSSERSSDISPSSESISSHDKLRSMLFLRIFALVMAVGFSVAAAATGFLLLVKILVREAKKPGFFWASGCYCS